MANGSAAVLLGTMSDRTVIIGFFVALGAAAVLFVAWAFGFMESVMHLQGA